MRPPRSPPRWPERASKRSSPAPAARRWWASTPTKTASRKWSRASTRTSTSCRPSCCATALSTGSRAASTSATSATTTRRTSTTTSSLTTPGARPNTPTDYNPADAVRETPTDVEYAAKWSSTNKLRMDMLFNGGGSAQYSSEHGSDPLLTAFQKYKSSFGWISHTWDHPNLDIGCASQSYIEAEQNENNTFATSSLGLTASTSPTAALGNDNPSVIITGEHSGLANLLPGNPGVVDPPDLDSAEADTTAAEGKLAAGSYVYAVTDDFVAGGGQSIASESSPVTVTGTDGTVTLAWDAVCHAAEFKVYRELAGSNQWKLIATIPAPTQAPPNTWFSSPLTNTAVTGGGALELTLHRHGRRRLDGLGAAERERSRRDRLSAEPQPDRSIQRRRDPVLRLGRLEGLPQPGHPRRARQRPIPRARRSPTAPPRRSRATRRTSTTTSRPRRKRSTSTTVCTPRPPRAGNACPARTPPVRRKPATFAEIVSDVDTNMFQHVMGNDPRPHYFHQPNIMGSPPPGPPTSGTPPGNLQKRRRRAVLLGPEPAARTVQQVFQRPDRTADDGPDRPAAGRAAGMESSEHGPGERLHRRQPGHGQQLGRRRRQCTFHWRHRYWIELRRNPIGMDERAGRHEHPRDPGELARSRESHDGEPAPGQRAGRLFSDARRERRHDPLQLVAEQRLAPRRVVPQPAQRERSPERRRRPGPRPSPSR